MRLGIMGGTFDPIHLGHLQIARLALKEAALHQVVFLPDGDPPHKEPNTHDTDRLLMVTLAVLGEEGFLVSDMEMKRVGTTYTVDTLLELQKMDEGYELYYIVGSDTLRLFPTWKSAGQVATLCKMIVAPRPGDDKAETRWFADKLFSDFGLQTLILSQPGPDISSTAIRERVKAGLPIKGLVPDLVDDYIQEKGLYLS